MKVNDTALNGKIRMPQDKFAYFADFLNAYLIRFSKLHLLSQRYQQKIVKTNKKLV